MKRQDYHRKLDDILNFPQFEKVTNTRKNAKHPVLKEEERVVDVLKKLRNNEKIDKELYKKLSAGTFIWTREGSQNHHAYTFRAVDAWLQLPQYWFTGSWLALQGTSMSNQFVNENSRRMHRASVWWQPVGIPDLGSNIILQWHHVNTQWLLQASGRPCGG